MTTEQYKSELDEIESKMIVLENRKKEIRSVFLKANSRFNIGDKVRVVFNERTHPLNTNRLMPAKEIEVFIGEIEDKYYQGKVKYVFKKVKKDGAMSEQSTYISGTFDRIELIQQFKNKKL